MLLLRFRPTLKLMPAAIKQRRNQMLFVIDEGIESAARKLPEGVLRLMRSLLRGHLQHWTVLLYSSRAKTLQHCSNLARAPLDSQSPWLPVRKNQRW